MRWWAACGVGAALLVWCIITLVRRVRHMMSRLMAVLFGPVLFPYLVQLIYALLGPVLRTFGLEPLFLRTVLEKAAEAIGGGTPTYAVMGTYTAEEQQDIVESLAALLQAVVLATSTPTAPAPMGLVLSTENLARLVAAIAERVVVPEA